MADGSRNAPAAGESAVGERVRRLRHQLGLTQEDLAGADYSAAYVSTIETGRRKPSTAVLRYLAERLGVEVGDLASDRGAEWSLQLARDLRSRGRSRAAVDLLERALTNLEGAGRVAPGVLVVMHREMAATERKDDPSAAERHLERALEYVGRGEVAVREVALTYLELGDLHAGRGDDHEAASAYRAAAVALLDLVRTAPPGEA
jgi:transcriptional regulator with XRE-family HTH domain